VNVQYEFEWHFIGYFSIISAIIRRKVHIREYLINYFQFTVTIVRNVCVLSY